MEKKLELLAPAGDFESLKTAVYNGADAVYFGMGGFNARMKAVNFDNNIAEAIDFCHLFGVKVYITLNTLVKNAEIPEMLDTAKKAVESGADAFIIQDLGVADIIKKCFPSIELHASTQMGIHNLYGAKIAEKLGFKRIVLSRETKLQDIIEIKKNTNLEIEYFVQGALCVAFSGNCYLSSLLKDNSGNRGKCLQLCRLKYQAYDNQKQIDDNYLLSPADLCLIENLQKLIDAGVTSFKIEGRMRRPAYVGVATSCYRKALDGINGLDYSISKEQLKKVFYRGEYLTNAYLDEGVPDRIINKQNQNHIGVKIGTVVQSKPFKTIYRTVIESKHEIRKGDGLKIFSKGIQIGSLGVGNLEKVGINKYAVYGNVNAKSQDEVNLILDNESEKQVLEKQTKIKVDCCVKALVNSSLNITFSFKNVKADVSGEMVLEQAKNAPTSVEEIKTQTSKTGDTYFEVENVMVETDGVFIPKSVFNSVRREGLIKLQKEIIKNNTGEISINLDMINSIKQQAEDYSKRRCNPTIFYSEGEDGNGCFSNGDMVIGNLKNGIDDSVIELINGGKILKIPTISNQKDYQIIESKINKNKVVLVNNIGGLYLIQNGYTVYGGFGLNVYNNFTANILKELGISKYTVSIELAKDEFLFDKYACYQNDGYIAYMTFAHCPYKTIYGGKCANCKYKEGLIYKGCGESFSIIRNKIVECRFEMRAKIKKK